MSIRYTHRQGPALLKPGTGKPAQSLSSRDRAIAKLTELQEQERTTHIQAKTQPTTAPAVGENAPPPAAGGATASQVVAAMGDGGGVAEPTPTSPAAPPTTTGTVDTNEGSVVSVTPAETSQVPEEPKPSAQDPHAILARKERALRQKQVAQEQALREREAALKAREEVLQQMQQTPTQRQNYISKDELLADPFTVLSSLGLSYDQLTQLAINAPKQEDIERQLYQKKIEQELESQKREIENFKKQAEEQQKRSYEQAKVQIHNEIKSLVTRDPAFETIRATGSTGDVVELIEKTFNEEGILLSAEEAAQQVEEYLVEEALKIARLSKIQGRLGAPKVVAAPATPPTQATTSMKTLTNSVASTRPLSPRERALLAFQGKLNK